MPHVMPIHEDPHHVDRLPQVSLHAYYGITPVAARIVSCGADNPDMELPPPPSLFSGDPRVLSDGARSPILPNQVLNALQLLRQLGLRHLDFLLQPLIDVKVVHYLVRPIPGGPQRHRVKDALLNAVRITVCQHCGGKHVIRGSGGDKGADSIDDRHSG